MRDVTVILSSSETMKCSQVEDKELLKLFIDYAPVGLAMFDCDMRYLFVSRRWLTDYSLGDRNLRGLSHYEVFPEIPVAWKEAHRRGLAGEVVKSDGDRFERLDGSVQWVRWEIRPWYTTKQVIGGILIFTEDITAHQVAIEALQRSEMIYRAIGESINYGVWICTPDGRNIYASESFLNLVGITQEQCANFGWGDVLHPDDANRTITAWKKCAHTGNLWDIEHRFRGVDGRYHFILARGVPVRNKQGEIVYWAGINLDIDRIKQVEEKLRRSIIQVQYYHDHMVTLNHMNNMLLSCEAQAEAYEVIMNSMRTLFPGCSGCLAIREKTHSNLRVVAAWGDSLLLPETFPHSACWALRQGTPYEVSDATHGVHCQHFSARPEHAYLCVPLTIQSETLGLLHVSTAVILTEESFQEWCTLVIKASGSMKLALSNLKLQDALRDQAIRDPLTGLFNRRYLDEILNHELNRCQRTGESLTVAMLDLDDFKGFNDTFGHEAGDVILRGVSDLLRGFLRGSDLACRYGGDELVLVFINATANQIKIKLESLRYAIEKLHLPYQGSDLPKITVSIGVAALEEQEVNTTALLSRADAALYQAKKQGRNRIVT